MFIRGSLRFSTWAGIALWCAGSALWAAPVNVSQGISHDIWEKLLRRYVRPDGPVDYHSWKGSGPDRAALREYLAEFGPADELAKGDEQIASLINGYNAFTIQWILDHYPVQSIQSLPDSWSKPRHRVGGRLVSLDEIEHETLRPLAGCRVHAALVCAARSCPPLRREPYRAERLDAQLEDAMRQWLACPDLNRPLPHQRRAEVSAIFQWFAKDFAQCGGLRVVLTRYAPRSRVAFLQTEYQVNYLPSDWSLNDTPR